MTVWFISRHAGAVEWAQRHGLVVDHVAAHFDPEQAGPGDTVIGSLPVNLAATVCAAGARYLHLSLELPVALRGQELTADQMEALEASLEEFCVTALTQPRS